LKHREPETDHKVARQMTSTGFVNRRRTAMDCEERAIKKQRPNSALRRDSYADRIAIQTGSTSSGTRKGGQRGAGRRLRPSGTMCVAGMEQAQSEAMNQTSIPIQ
jgi:hypothetical protein